MTTHVQQTLPFPWQGERQCSLQLLIQPWIQPWIFATSTHYGWVDRGSVECLPCTWPALRIEPQTFGYMFLGT